MSSSSFRPPSCSLPSDLLCNYSYFSTALDAKGNVADAVRDEVFRRLRSKLENRSCIDCNSRNPTWLSLSYAVFLCLTCSGKHRRMGTHVSFVRSTEMDKFSPEQLLRIELGGNGKARLFFRDHGLLDGKHIEYQTSRVAVKYKQHLDKEVQTTLHKTTSPSVASVSCSLLPSSPTSAVSPDPVLTTSSPMALSTSSGSSSGSGSGTGSSGSSSSGSCNGSSSSGSSSSSSGSGGGSGGGTDVPSHDAGYVGSRVGGIKSKKMDVDFDFEANEAASTFFLPTRSPRNLKDNIPCTPSDVAPSSSCFTSHLAVERQPPPRVTDASLNRFVDAKAISSEQFFNSNQQTRDDFSPGEVSTRFASNTAISSGSLFGDEQQQQQQRSRTIEAVTADKLENLKDSAREGMSALAAASSDAMSRLGTWMNS
eukprot:GHVS01031857.1.p1 GENE.GHVS01031857.1~~GHVS01031857.1.p1  ORF type:complete len:455 (+),score=149.57 GHVS01031857.1:94-1365(+)